MDFLLLVVSGFEVAAPSLAHLFAFLDSLAVGTFLDRGRGRRASAVATLAALQFGAWKLGLSVLGKLAGFFSSESLEKGNGLAQITLQGSCSIACLL